MRACFNVFGSQGEVHEVFVDLKWWGGEYYYVDGNLMYRKFSMGMSGVRSFEVAGKRVDIYVAVTINSFDCYVNIDNQLYIPELFPDLSDKIRRRKEKFKKLEGSKSQKSIVHKIVKNIILWIIIATVLFFVFENR